MVCCGIPIIDFQHEELITAVHSAVDAFRKTGDTEIVVELLYRAERYAKIHLKTEEALMRKYNYFDYENHKAVHSDFMYIISEAIKLVKQTGIIEEKNACLFRKMDRRSYFC